MARGGSSRHLANRSAVLKTSNGGQASAMNDGVSVATGDIVIFPDSDDHLAPDAVETLPWRLGNRHGVAFADAHRRRRAADWRLPRPAVRSSPTANVLLQPAVDRQFR